MEMWRNLWAGRFNAGRSHAEFTEESFPAVRGLRRWTGHKVLVASRMLVIHGRQPARLKPVTQSKVAAEKLFRADVMPYVLLRISGDK